jgi:hypothetical protein
MLQSNLAALDVTVPGEALERLAALREDPELYWETRSELPWN